MSGGMGAQDWLGAPSLPTWYASRSAYGTLPEDSSLRAQGQAYRLFLRGGVLSTAVMDQSLSSVVTASIRSLTL